MADWLPNATRQTWGTSGGSWLRPPSLICLHSVEGNGWPGYGAGASAPHLTLHPGTGELRQHIPFSVAARALARPTAVQTNRMGAIQVEIIGTSDRTLADRHGWTFLPHVGDVGRRHIARLLAAINQATGIPLVTTVDWRPYPASYGIHAPQRLSVPAWNTYRGVLAHQHVPTNDHGDVPLPIREILAIARGSLNPTPPQEDTLSAKAEGQIAATHLLAVQQQQRQAAADRTSLSILVPAWYDLYLGRRPTRTTVANFMARFDAGASLVDLEQSVRNSPEAKNREKAKG